MLRAIIVVGLLWAPFAAVNARPAPARTARTIADTFLHARAEGGEGDPVPGGDKSGENKGGGEKKGDGDTPAGTGSGDSGDPDKKSVDLIPPKIVPSDATIIVNGRALTGPLSFPQQRGDRSFLPLASIARALGDKVSLNMQSRTVEVRRQTGVVADFNAQLNQVRENGSVILAVANTADIVFPPNPDELMLPIEIIAALLDISVIVDATARAVRITRGLTPTDTVRAGARQEPGNGADLTLCLLSADARWQARHRRQFRRAVLRCASLRRVRRVHG